MQSAGYFAWTFFAAYSRILLIKEAYDDSIAGELQQHRHDHARNFQLPQHHPFDQLFHTLPQFSPTVHHFPQMAAISNQAIGQANTFGTFGKLNLSINGIGVQYPPYLLDHTALSTLVARHYPESPAMKKVLAINEFTGIDTRSAIGTVDHPMANQKNPPTIDELCATFLSDAVPLAVSASRKAIFEAGLTPSDITHVVSTTCTNSANPGFDHYVCRGLGITQPVEKVLLHGVGCSGGLAALRTAANLALGSTFRGRKARILVVAAEISSLLVRSELDSIHAEQATRIGVTLFSDCASAAVLSNGLGAKDDEESVFELLGWDHSVIPDTEEDLGFDVDPLGWKVVLTPRVPKLATSVVSPTFDNLLSSLPATQHPNLPSHPADFDWALHPGGATILSGVERAMSLTAEHMRASYDTYINHGNSSSATIFSVLDRLRTKDMDELAPPPRSLSKDNGGSESLTDTVPPPGPKEYVVGCAFGPGIAIEMCMLKRNMDHNRSEDHDSAGAVVPTGEMTPPETDRESEGSRSESELEPEKMVKTSEGGDSLSEALNGVELD